MSDKLFIDYHTLQKDTLTLAEKLAKSDLFNQHTQLICVSRGGLFIGAILSYALGFKDVYCVSLESYTKEDNGGNEEVVCRTPFLPHLDMREEESPDLWEKLKARYLVVDDINDTSQTYQFIIDKMNEYGLDFQFATTYHKKRETNLIPNFIGKEFESDCWVVFPWDQL